VWVGEKERMSGRVRDREKQRKTWGGGEYVMYTCICVCAHVYVCVHGYASVRACMYVYLGVYVCVCNCVV